MATATVLQADSERDFTGPQDEKQSDATLKGSTPNELRRLQAEKSAMEANATKAGMSMFMYLRNVGIGYQIKGTIDQDWVLMLAKINKDQGGLAGAVELWLAHSEKLGRTIPTTCVKRFTACLNASSKCRQRCFIL